MHAYFMNMSKKIPVLKKINLSLSWYNRDEFPYTLAKRPRAESTHPETWANQPTYQGRNDPQIKMAEKTQAKTNQAEATQGRNNPYSL